MKTFAITLKNLRKQSGLTQKELADKVNVSPQVVSNWERDYTQPSLSELISIADALCVTLDVLVGRNKFETELLIKAKALTDSQLELVIKLMNEMV